MAQIFGSVWNDLFGVLKALILLIVAFVAASVVKGVALKLIERTRLNGLLYRADGNSVPPGTTKEYIGKLVYFLVFLLFVPGIFDLLGAQSVAAPIMGFLNEIWGYLPKALAAGIILTVGMLIAKLVRQLLVPVFARLRVDAIQQKAGIEVPDAAKLSNTLAYIVYVLIVIPVVIMAIQALGIQAISEPAVSMLYVVFSFIPNIIVGLLIIGLGWMIARFAGQIVERLIAATGIDDKLADQLDAGAKGFVLSHMAGLVAQGAIVIFFCVEGCNVLGLAVLTQIGSAVIAFMPRALAAIVVFAAASLGASALVRILQRNGLEGYTAVARLAIYAVAAFMILDQLGIAANIVSSAFILLLAAVAVAFAIAFGIGGREVAAGLLRKWTASEGAESAEKKDSGRDKARTRA